MAFQVFMIRIQVEDFQKYLFILLMKSGGPLIETKKNKTSSPKSALAQPRLIIEAVDVADDYI